MSSEEEPGPSILELREAVETLREHPRSSGYAVASPSAAARALQRELYVRLGELGERRQEGFVPERGGWVFVSWREFSPTPDVSQLDPVLSRVQHGWEPLREGEYRKLDRMLGCEMAYGYHGPLVVRSWEVAEASYGRPVSPSRCAIRMTPEAMKDYLRREASLAAE